MAGDVRAGKAFIEMYLKDDAFRKGLRRLRRGLTDMVRFTANVAKGFAALGVGAAVALVPAIKAASELEETMNKFNVVFGDNAKAVVAWGNTFAKQVGRSKNEVMGFLAGTQDLLVPLGFASDEAENMSKQITALAFDLASFNNLNDADVVRDLHAALTGSSEVMKKYGVVINETAIKQEALNQGFNPKNLNEQQKALLRLELIMRGTTAAQGDVIRSGDSFANQMKATKAVIVDLAAQIGGFFLPVIADALKTVQAFVALFAAGDFSGAMELAWAQALVVWEKGTTSIRKFWIDAWVEIQKVAFSVFEGVMGGWATLVTGMRNLWTDAFAFIEKTVLRVLAFFDKSIDLEATLREIDQGAEATKAERRAALSEQLQQLAAQSADFTRVAEQGGAAEKAALPARVLAAQEAFQRRREAALKVQEQAAIAFGESLPGLHDLATAVADAKGVSATASGGKGPTTSSLGVFDARFAGQIFGQGGVEQRQLRELQGIHRVLQRRGGIPVTA